MARAVDRWVTPGKGGAEARFERQPTNPPVGTHPEDPKSALRSSASCSTESTGLPPKNPTLPSALRLPETVTPLSSRISSSCSVRAGDRCASLLLFDEYASVDEGYVNTLCTVKAMRTVVLDALTTTAAPR